MRLLILLLIIISLSANAIEIKKKFTITPNTTQEQLKEIKQYYLQKDCVLEFENAEFVDGVLVQLKGKLTTRFNQSTSFEGDNFEQIILWKTGVKVISKPTTE